MSIGDPTVNPADTTRTPDPPGPSSHRTWLELAKSALGNAQIRRDALIALAMVLATIILSAWLLAGTPTWLALTGSATAGTGIGLATHRRSRRRSRRLRARRPKLSDGGT